MTTYGVKRYGLKVDEPFHTPGIINQDSLGRLRFKNFLYDGKTFIRTQKKNNPIHLIEKDGSYWESRDAFHVQYFTETDTFLINTQTHFPLPQVDVAVSGDDKYILSSKGISHYRLEQKQLVHIKNVDIPGEDIYNSIIIGDTLFLKKSNSSTYHLLSSLGTEHIVSDTKISFLGNDILMLTNDRICLKAKSSISILDSNDFFHSAILKNIKGRISDHYLDSKGRLWLATQNDGLSRIEIVSKNGEIEQVLTDGESKDYLEFFYEDNHGSIWIGTRGRGLIQVFEQSIKVLNKESGLSTDNIWSIKQSSTGDIYFITGCYGTDIIRLDGRLDHMLGTNCNFTTHFDSQDRMWIALDGVTMFTKEGKKFNYQKDKGLVSRTVKTIVEDSNKDIWIGTRKAVHKFVGDGFQKYIAPGVAEFDRVLSMIEYNQGAFLIGFVSGKVFSFDGKNFQQLDYPGQGLNTLFKDLEGNIIACSDSTGLYRFENLSFQSIKGKDLPKSIKLIQDDLKGFLWGLCEGNQVFRCKKESLLNKDENFKVDYFGIDEGVPLLATNNDVFPNTELLNDGRIIFPNIYGAILIDPENVNVSVAEYSTVLYHNNRKVDDRIELNYGENDLSIHLKSINIAPNKKIFYQYKIKEEWINIESTEQIFINNLESGKNTIKLRGMPFNGEWKEIKQFAVIVPMLYYEYPLFWLALIVLSITTIYSIVLWRTKIEKDRNRILEERVEEQTEALNQEKQQLAESLKKQKQLTKELNYSQASKNRMYAQISHEFKSPLQAIKSHLEKGEGYINIEDKKRISGNINNLLGISNEIMELSKAESGKLKLKKNWYNINGVIQDQIELKRQLARDKHVEILFSSQEERQFLFFDLPMIQKVLSNLLSNAIKFSPIHSTISITSEIDKDQHRICISDEGLGIPAAEIENLTMAYYQASNNTEEGTGIGLSLVKEILKLHESELEIRSELDIGSMFSFSLERSSKSQNEIIAENINQLGIEKQLNAIVDSSKPLILAVDDSHDVLYFITNALTPKYNVICTVNGAEAIDILEKIVPSAIISDFNMPIMNGIQLLKAVRSIPKLQVLPFLFLTGSSSEETEILSIKAGADIILQKPIQEELLVSQVAQILKRQKTISTSIKSSFVHNLLPPNIHNDDLELMKSLETIFLEHIDNSKLKSEDIAQIIGIGEKTLRNRVKKISGKTLKEYLRNFRLEKAKLLIEEKYGTMGEVAAATGFSSLSYFSKCYRKYFDL